MNKLKILNVFQVSSGDTNNCGQTCICSAKVCSKCKADKQAHCVTVNVLQEQNYECSQTVCFFITNRHTGPYLLIASNT